MRGLVKAAIAVVVLLALLVVADRVSLAVAESSAASKLANYGQFQSKPSVHIGGFPFLTQAIGGKYHDVEVKSSAVTVGVVQNAGFDVHLRGMQLPLGKAFGGQVDSVDVDHVEGTVVISYADLSRISRVSGLTFSRAGDSLRIAGTVNVAGLGTVGPVGVTASAAIVGGGLKIAVKSLQVAGSSVAGSTLALVNDTLSSALVLPTLPYGLKLSAVSVNDTGLVLHGLGTNVILTKPS
jgi:LmeA-like phospholipid-binding